MKIESTTFVLEFHESSMELDASEVMYDVASMYQASEAEHESPSEVEFAYLRALQAYLEARVDHPIPLSAVQMADRLISHELEKFKKKLPPLPTQLDALGAPPANSPKGTSVSGSLSLDDLPHLMKSESETPKGSLPQSGYDSLPTS